MAISFWRFLAVAMVLALAVRWRAQAADAPPELPLTWPEVRRLADQDPRLAAAGQRVAAAQGGRRAAGAAPGASVAATIGRGEARQGSASAQESGVEVSVPLGWLAQRPGLVRAAEAEVEAARGEERQSRDEALLAIHELFWDLARGQAQVETLAACAAHAGELARLVRDAVRLGERRPVEQTRAELLEDELRIRLDSARGELETARARLRAWLNAGAEPVAVADLAALPAPGVIPDLDAAVERQPAVQAAQARERVRESEVVSARLAALPGLSASVYGERELDREAYGLGLSLELPGWGQSAGGVAAAQARWNEARAESEAARREAAGRLRGLEAECRAAVASAERYRSGMVRRSESAAEAFEAAYRLGDTGLSEVLLARREACEARLGSAEAAARAQQACGRLRVALGEEL